MLCLRTILLVDDSAEDVELTLAALSQNRVANEVVVVRDGAEALDYLYRRAGFTDRATRDPALILLDLKMPKVDGVEVLRQIKSDAALRTIPVVVLTSSRENYDVRRTYDLGVNAYVVKPVAFPDFMAAVQTLGQFWAVINEAPPTSPPPGR
jgi:CheY-like chemotaxis protein